MRWLIICLVFILLSLLEYAWILAFYHAEKKNSYKEPDVQKLSRSLIDVTVVESTDHSVTRAKNAKIPASRIDNVALVVFPALFALTSVLFSLNLSQGIL